MGQSIDYLKLMRVQQWYKNIVVFIALIFSLQFFQLNSILLSLTGFFALCFISSANYIINDIKDLKKDKKHPLKKERPLASAKVSLKAATILGILLFIIGILIAFSLNPLFMILTLGLFILMQLYTFFLKDIAYLDVTMIAIFFVFRAVLGALALLVWVSPWLIICPFFLALYLAFCKRYSDLKLLEKEQKNNLGDTRKSLDGYSEIKIKQLILGSSVLLLISFTWYSLQNHLLLLINVILAICILQRYWKLVVQDPYVGLQTQRAIKDWKLFLLGLSWIITLFITLSL